MACHDGLVPTLDSAVRVSLVGCLAGKSPTVSKGTGYQPSYFYRVGASAVRNMISKTEDWLRLLAQALGNT